MRNIVLDFDGTLGDTQKLIVRTLQDTMRAMSLPVKGEAECAATIGLRLDEAFCQLFGLSQDAGMKCAETYRKLFLRNQKVLTVTPFPHVVETLRQLHADGYVLAVASSRGRDSLLSYLRQLQIAPCIRVVVASEDVAHAKPAPDMVLKAVDQMGGTVSETLVVGDMTYDVDMAHHAGAMACAVTYGNGTRSQLAAADFLIDDFAALVDVVKKL